MHDDDDDDDVYTTCIQLVVPYDDYVNMCTCVHVYMLFHIIMCTVHILIMYNACIGLTGCLSVRCH